FPYWNDCWAGRSTSRADDTRRGKKVNHVCNDKASRFIFHIFNCKGCREFMRKQIKIEKKPDCPERKKKIKITRFASKQIQIVKIHKCVQSYFRRAMMLGDREVSENNGMMRQTRCQKLGRDGPLRKGVTGEKKSFFSKNLASLLSSFASKYQTFKIFRYPKVKSSSYGMPRCMQKPSTGEEVARYSVLKDCLQSLPLTIQQRGERGNFWNWETRDDSSCKQMMSTRPKLGNMSATYLFHGVIIF
uniref:Nuclear receptor domain-containing protein n=1 Tax=Sus scrofa TaxID=9823 RepID=A0A8D1YE28_PIG